jgi:hypothetical protein
MLVKEVMTPKAEWIDPEARTRTGAYITDTAASEAARVEAAWDAARNLEEKPFWQQWLDSRLGPSEDAEAG